MDEVYGIFCPDTGRLRYVGKARSAQERLMSHARDARRRSTPFYRWLRPLLERGIFPPAVVLASTWDWAATERAVIAQARADGEPLLNVASGGNGPYCSTDTRAANGRATARAIHDNPERRRIWATKHLLGCMRRRHGP